MRKPANPDNTRRYGERNRVRWLSKAVAGVRYPQLALGIGDDAAVLRTKPGEQTVVTTDFCLEGVHFRRDWHTPEQAGHRCLARGLSDLAAMGAKPTAAFLSLALPADLAGQWADGFFRGLLALAAQHRVPLAGGDLAASPTGVFADIVLLGTVPAGHALLRSAARAGDAIYVTGTLGGAAAELDRVSQRGKPIQTKAGAPHPHLMPVPRTAAGIALRKLGLRTSGRIACMDISDGLALDLSRLCEASGVHAELDAVAIPVAKQATLQQALTGGEDYELLFTAPARQRLPKQLAGAPITRIGRVLRSKKGRPAMTLLQPDGRVRALEPAGWQYFN